MVKTRCNECNKKITEISSYTCNCGYILCSNHRYTFTHKCSYNHKKGWDKKLKNSLPLIKKEKVPII